MSAGSIVIACPGCQKRFKGSVTLAGRQVKCPACKRAISVPAEAPKAVAVGTGQSRSTSVEPPAEQYDNPFDNPAVSTMLADVSAEREPRHDVYRPPNTSAISITGEHSTHGTAYGIAQPVNSGGTAYDPATAQQTHSLGNSKAAAKGIGAAVMLCIVGGIIWLVTAHFQAAEQKNESTAQKLSGTWRVVMLNGAPMPLPPEAPADTRILFTFKPSGIISITAASSEGNTFAGSGTWEVDGKNVNLNLSDWSTGRRQSDKGFVKLQRLDDTSLTLTVAEGTMELERVKAPTSSAPSRWP